MQELLNAPENVLSLYALSKVVSPLVYNPTCDPYAYFKMLKPEYTMNGLEIADDMTANGSAHMTTLGTVLKNNLDVLESAVLGRMAHVLREQVLHSTESLEGCGAGTRFVLLALSHSCDCVVFRDKPI